MKAITSRRVWQSIVLACTVLMLIACERKSINQILADPHRYAHREVTVIGQVVQSYSVLGMVAISNRLRQSGSPAN